MLSAFVTTSPVIVVVMPTGVFPLGVRGSSLEEQAVKTANVQPINRVACVNCLVLIIFNY